MTGGPSDAGRRAPVRLGVAGAVADPRLQLYSGSGVALANNDNWGGTPELVSAFTTTGAFALPTASRDAALLFALPRGAFTAHLIPADGAGIALVEVYDADSATPSTTGSIHPLA